VKEAIKQDAAKAAACASPAEKPLSQRVSEAVGELAEKVKQLIADTMGKSAKQAEAVIQYAPGINRTAVSPHSEQVLKDIMKSSNTSKIRITSTARTASQQANAMYDNLEGTGKGKGVAAQRKLYGPNGDKVIDAYEESRAAGKSPDEIKADMTARIMELGPSIVSKHAADTARLNVVDVSPKTISDRKAFEEAVEKAKAEGKVSRFLKPPTDPVYHIEIPQPQ
jgi:hypothetical protein